MDLHQSALSVDQVYGPRRLGFDNLRCTLFSRIPVIIAELLADQTSPDLPMKTCQLMSPVSLCKWFNYRSVNYSTTYTFDFRVDELHINFCRGWIHCLCLHFIPSLISLSKVILAVRTFAVWNRNRIIGSFLMIAMVVDVAIRFYVIQMFLSSMECTYYVCKVEIFNFTVCIDAPPPYPGFRGYFFIKAKNIFWMVYTLEMVLQASTCCWLFMISIWTRSIGYFVLMAMGAFRAC
jgi:hypothetical protein